jgi:hypothetical protein
MPFEYFSDPSLNGDGLGSSANADVRRGHSNSGETTGGGDASEEEEARAAPTPTPLSLRRRRAMLNAGDDGIDEDDRDDDDDDDDARERGAPKRGEAATAEATTDMTTDGERREIARGSPGMEATRAKGRRYYSLSCSTKIESLERRHFLGSIPVSNGR